MTEKFSFLGTWQQRMGNAFGMAYAALEMATGRLGFNTRVHEEAQTTIGKGLLRKESSFTNEVSSLRDAAIASGKVLLGDAYAAVLGKANDFFTDIKVQLQNAKSDPDYVAARNKHASNFGKDASAGYVMSCDSFIRAQYKKFIGEAKKADSLISGAMGTFVALADQVTELAHSIKNERALLNDEAKAKIKVEGLFKPSPALTKALSQWWKNTRDAAEVSAYRSTQVGLNNDKPLDAMKDAQATFKAERQAARAAVLAVSKAVSPFYRTDAKNVFAAVYAAMSSDPSGASMVVTSLKARVLAVEAAIAKRFETQPTCPTAEQADQAIERFKPTLTILKLAAEAIARYPKQATDIHALFDTLAVASETIGAKFDSYAAIPAQNKATMLKVWDSAASKIAERIATYAESDGKITDEERVNVLASIRGVSTAVLIEVGETARDIEELRAIANRRNGHTADFQTNIDNAVKVAVQELTDNVESLLKEGRQNP
jgi:hypothetical protein